jgi:hypothetical protein
MTLDRTAGELPKHCKKVAEALTAGELLKHGPGHLAPQFPLPRWLRGSGPRGGPSTVESGGRERSEGPWTG